MTCLSCTCCRGTLQCKRDKAPNCSYYLANRVFRGVIVYATVYFKDFSYDYGD